MIILLWINGFVMICRGICSRVLASEDKSLICGFKISNNLPKAQSSILCKRTDFLNFKFKLSGTLLPVRGVPSETCSVVNWWNLVSDSSLSNKSYLNHMNINWKKIWILFFGFYRASFIFCCRFKLSTFLQSWMRSISLFLWFFKYRQ